MIFVTVGSIQFDELVKEIDFAVGGGQITGEVVIQIANGSYLPANCEYFRSAPGLDPYYERAGLVISHGGATTLEVLERGLRLISVSNPNLSDDHQRDFLEVLANRGFIQYCRVLSELPVFIHESLVRPPPPAFDVNVFFRTVVDDLENMQQAPQEGFLTFRW